MTDPEENDALPLRRRLAEELAQSGDLRSTPWREAIEAVPRQTFIPAFFEQMDSPRETLWSPVTAELVGSKRRLDLTYTNETWVTQVNHMTGPADTDVAIPGIPTSSSTLPGLVVRMLEDLQIEDGSSVLEIGTGTGYSTALMCERLGDELVTSVEVDPDVAGRAKGHLAAAGYHPNLVVTDGLAGHPPGALYDRVIATCSVRRIPPAWIAQTRPGGTVLSTMQGWLGASSGLVRLTVTGEGTAEGVFLPGTVSFMPARPDEPPALAEEIDFEQFGVEEVRATEVGPDVLEDWAGQYVAQLAAPTAQLLSFSIGDGPMVDYLIDQEHRSIAALTQAEDGSYRVGQAGPSRIWDAVEQAIADWRDAGRPDLDQFRMTVTPQSQVVWFGDPAGPLSWRLPPWTRR